MSRLVRALSRWPVIRQVISGGHGTGQESMSAATSALRPRNEETQVARSICPYCAVGCGQLVFHRHNALVSIEGDPASPISAGHLCPKGAASFQLLTHDQRAKTVRYRAPHATSWTDLDLETAMDMIADRVWSAREQAFEETRDGVSLMQTPNIAHLGGATLDNEENYLLKKLFTAGLGMVCVSNQARI
jgi:formate dehydrogenase major subunit